MKKERTRKVYCGQNSATWWMQSYSRCPAYTILKQMMVPYFADACTTKPCKNSGVCSVDGASYTCKCAKGFTGKTCEGRFGIKFIKSYFSYM